MEQNNNPENIDGFMFADLAERDRAKKEYETIARLKKGINPENTDELERLYFQLSAKQYFFTPVGFSFMKGLRSYIIEQKGYSEETLPYVKIPKKKAAVNGMISKGKYDSVIKSLDKLKITRIRLGVAVAALAIAVIGMLIIAMTNDNSGYFNAEEKVLDKYSAWEEELNWREALLDEREEALQNNEK